jgi:hypothetical protein
MKLLALLILLLISGCRTPQDITPAPINHNKMTLELQSCGKQEVGLAGCFYNERQEGNLTIPLWHKGEYQIQSERCGFFQNRRYEESEELELSYQELLADKPDSETTCLYNIKVFIDKFDNGFEGFFVLSKGDINALKFNFINKEYTGYAGVQIKEGTESLNSIQIVSPIAGTVFWQGCNKSGEKKYQANPAISLREVIGDVVIPKYSCVLTIGLIPNDIHEPVELGKVHINIFEKVLIPLAEPSLDYRRGRLTVKADRLVAAIAINNNVSIEYGSGIKRYRRNVQKDEIADVRIMTSNGRFLLLKVKNGEVLWVK